MGDVKKSPFTYSVLPLDIFPDHPPLPEAEEMALHDVCVQLVVNLTAASKTKNPLRGIQILAHCVSILDDYAAANFTQLADFRRELQTDLHNALRKARRFFLREMFLSSEENFPRFIQTLRDSGWTTSGEPGQDYAAVIDELFIDGGHRFKPHALALRAERRNRH